MTWYEHESYGEEEPIPQALTDDPAMAGPRGIAVASVFAEGLTTSGWGLAPTPAREGRPARPGFMADYEGLRFESRVRRLRFLKRGEPFAFIMRSMNLLVLDIDRHLDDGGADGFEGAVLLGDLPETLAETSKSGAGRHLFYRTPDSWDPDRGFGMFEDAIGLVPGVDVRVTGCVYHYPTQRWNGRDIADAPATVLEMLDRKTATKLARKTAVAAAAAADPDDVEALIMHDTLLLELNKPVATGKRNNTLFAIGSQMKDAAYPGWQDEVRRRAGELGMDLGEDEKIIANIERQP